MSIDRQWLNVSILNRKMNHKMNTFVDQENEPEIAKLHNSRLNVCVKPFPAWCTPSNANDYLSNETTV